MWQKWQKAANTSEKSMGPGNHPLRRVLKPFNDHLGVDYSLQNFYDYRPS